jgi:PiT family inorganic phosphate transporter
LGLTAAGTQVKFGALGKGFILPLLLSPVLAVALASGLYALLRWTRLHLGITKEWYICVGETQQLVPMLQPTSAMALQVAAAPVLEITTGEQSECSERYPGRFLGIGTQRLMDTVHFFERGSSQFRARSQRCAEDRSYFAGGEGP